MLKKFTIYVLILGTLYACHKVEREYHQNGKLRSERKMLGSKMDGPFRIWYESGVMQQEAFYRNDILNGKMIRWYANGNKESEENYVEGLKNGTFRTWDEYGNLVEEKNFLNDTLHGKYRLYYSSGISRIEGAYSHGLYEGKWEYFSATGLKVGEGNYQKGTGVLSGYNSLGKKIHEVIYVNNQKNGNEVEFNPDGTPKSIKIFRNDSLISEKKLNE
jgi:antitoxin component YwqK of YwqJK toxin-antitoxin module